MIRVFDSAIQELERQKIYYSEPQSFKKYLESIEIPPKFKNTAEHLSVQIIDNLKPELRENNYMIFRLGSHEGENTTYFGLAKLQEKDNWSEYFLIDKEIFQNVEPEIFIPNVSIRQLFAFTLLSSLTENSLINLAISSGLLASALDIETSESLAAPASGQGKFSFEFKPSPEASKKWKHIKGQVEIDALFVGKQNRRETLFVIEAKTSDVFKSLAKHKLVYPVLALSHKVPGYIPIIPVYVRAVKNSKNRIDFYIAKCNELYSRNEDVAVSNLSVDSVRHLILMGFDSE